jgi:hypothetical protein
MGSLLQSLRRADSLFLQVESKRFAVSFFSPASISTRAGRSAAFVLPIMAAISFGTDGRAQTADVFFHPAPLSVSRDTLAAPGLSPLFENYAVDTRLRPLNIAPKLDFGSSVQWKEYPSLYRDNSEDSFGRVPLNGGSFGLESENKVDLKKIAPNEFVENNIERHAKKPFVGLSIVAPYSSE